ncbi:MAG: LuxR C-terminal-related transcriptional regulator [Actinomycetota bacterium]|nr:LuxR C-terminal-related transcriptional regulator [Actinomycetota bacterium]
MTLLETKLRIPSLRPEAIARQRLLDQLSRSASVPVTLVSAPAGFGKTTLVSQWAESARLQSHAVAWVSLTSRDNDPVAFWTYLASAVDAAAHGVGSQALALLALPASSTESVVTSLLNDIDRLATPLTIVLDDLHLVEASDVRSSVEFFVEHLPGNAHLILATRADPGLPLAQMRARGQLMEIRVTDLRFTLDEAVSYLNDSMGLALAPSDVASLEARTEGWIAALQLAALSVQGREDAHSFIASFAGDDRYVVDYLVDEVLARQPDDVREFLLRTSLLDTFSGPLCDAVTGQSNGKDRLASLERSNLFLVPLDDRREWYRYHHLFADVLRATLLSDHPGLAADLHRRASAWLEAKGLLDEAIAHAFAAGDVPRAAFLVELAIPAILRERRESLLADWLAALPAEEITARPVLAVYSGHMSLVAGDLDSADRRFAEAEVALSRAGEDARSQWAQTDALRTLPATIATYRAAIAQARGDVATMREQAARALDLAGPDDHFARGSAAGFLGLAAWSVGDIVEARTVFAQALASLHAGGNIVDELISTVALADMWVVSGCPSEAARLNAAALARAEQHGAQADRAAAYLHVAASQLATGAGDPESARRHLDDAARLSDPEGIGEGGFRWYVALADLRAAEGDYDAAVACLEQAEAMYRPLFLPEVRPIPAIRARIDLRRGNIAEAVRWAEAGAGARGGRSEYLREYEDLTRVRLQLALAPSGGAGILAEQAERLQALREHAAEAGRLGSLLEIAVCEALIRDRMGDATGAAGVLADALVRLPEPQAFADLFASDWGVLEPLLAEAALPGPEAEKADRVRARAARPRAARKHPGPAGADALSERERAVLRMLDTELTGPQIARELFISHNTMRTHTKRIFTKLDVTSRRAAVARARERGLI